MSSGALSKTTFSSKLKTITACFSKNLQSQMELHAICTITARHPKNTTSKEKASMRRRGKLRGHLGLPFFHSTGKHAKQKQKTPEKDPITHANMDNTCRFKTKEPG